MTDLAQRIRERLDEAYRPRVSHPLSQLADHLGAECRCMVAFPADPVIMASVSARVPMHPSELDRILRLSGAWCDHPQLSGWKLAEVTLPEPLVVPWPPALTDGQLCDFLRAEAGRRLGHDPKLVTIDLPHRDCPRHVAPPVEAEVRRG